MPDKPARSATNKKNRPRSRASPSASTDASPRGESGVRIVGIGASAGGLEALQQFFKSAPPDAGLAFVVVQHLDPAGHSQMPEILPRFTKMPVIVAAGGMPVETNHVYLNPPNRNIGIERGRIFLREPPQTPGARLPVDFRDYRGSA